MDAVCAPGAREETWEFEYWDTLSSTKCACVSVIMPKACAVKTAGRDTKFPQENYFATMKQGGTTLSLGCSHFIALELLPDKFRQIKTPIPSCEFVCET